MHCSNISTGQSAATYKIVKVLLGLSLLMESALQQVHDLYLAVTI